MIQRAGAAISMERTARGGERGGDAESRPIAAWIVCLLAVLTVFAQLTAMGANGALSSSLSAFGQLVLAMAALLLLGRDLEGARWRALLAPMLALVAALAWALVAPRPVSVDALQREALKLAGVGAVCLVGFLIGARRHRARLLVDLILAVGVVYLLLCLMLRQIDPFTIFGQTKGAHMWRFSGTLLNANGAAVVFGVLALIALAHMLAAIRQLPVVGGRTANLLRLGGGAVVASAALGACALTGSRLGFSVTALLSAIIVLTQPADRNRRAWGWIKGLVLALLVAGAALGGGPLLVRSTAYADDFADRLSGYGLYLGLFEQSPLHGWGLGAFQILNQAHLTMASAAGLWSFGSAHCAALQAALEGGWPFLALLVVAVGLIVVSIALGWSRVTRANVAAPGIAAALALVATASAVDIASNIPAVANFAMLVLGVLWGRSIATQRRLTP